MKDQVSFGVWRILDEVSCGSHNICEPVERGDSPNRAVPPLHVRVRSPKTHNKLNHFDDLGILCTNDHEHEPWGQTADGQWATALEVVYPWDLCRAMAGKKSMRLNMPFGAIGSVAGFLRISFAIWWIGTFGFSFDMERIL